LKPKKYVGCGMGGRVGGIIQLFKPKISPNYYYFYFKKEKKIFLHHVYIY
jgi:hypothetical protein